MNKTLNSILVFLLLAIDTNIRLSGQTFTPLFSLTNGSNPGNLSLSGNRLYGMSEYGGTYGTGMIFALNTDGTGYTPIRSFGPLQQFGYIYTNSDGANPGSGFVLSSNTIYGSTKAGGTNGTGTLFMLHTDGTGFTVTHSFGQLHEKALGVYTNSDGYGPASGLLLSGQTLYGVTASGGANGFGILFAMKLNGSDFTSLHSFGDGTDGGAPSGLALSGNTLYGTTATGGINNYGTVFSLNTDGSAFTTIHSFDVDVEGLQPGVSLLLVNNTLYGTMSRGGTNGAGTVYAINTDGTGAIALHSFGENDEPVPVGGVVFYLGLLYGTTALGGNGDGSIFVVSTNGTGFTNLYSFSQAHLSASGVYTNNDGFYPSGTLLLNASTLYGTAGSGGTMGDGTVFAVALTPEGDYTISVSGSPGSGGTVNGGGTFAAGSSQTLSAIANGDYTFANWTENGTVVSISTSYTFILSNNVSLVANFNTLTTNYTISVGASPTGGGTVSGGGKFASGSSQTVIATANPGYTFAAWVYLSSSPVYTFTLTTNIYLVAQFVGDGSLPNGQPTATYQIVDHPNAVNGTWLEGIQNTNLVGYYQDTKGSYHGFVYNGQSYTTIDNPNADYVNPNAGTSARGISGQRIIGDYVDDNSTVHGFLYNGNVYTDIDDPNARDYLLHGTHTRGIDGNTIVGYYDDTNGICHGFIYDDVNYVTLDAPAAGTNVGSGTFLMGIASNVITGYSADNNGNKRGFIYINGIFTAIDDPNAFYGSFSTGIVGTDVAGYYYYVLSDSDIQAYHSFYFDGSNYTTLNDLPGITDTEARAVLGTTVVGTYFAGPAGPAHGFYGTVTAATNTGASVGPGGASSRSDVWTQRISGTAENLQSVTWNGTQFAVVGWNGTILTSSNGINWATQSSGIDDDLYAITWDGNKFLAAARGGPVVTSPDGIIWTGQFFGSFVNDLYLAFPAGVASSGSQFVVAGSADVEVRGLDTGEAILWASPNIVQPSEGYDDWYSGVAWNGAYFVIVGSSGNILSSPTPTSYLWNAESSGTTNNLSGVAWNGTTFVAVGDNGTTLSSISGLNWISQSPTTKDNLSYLAACGTNFIAFGNEADLVHEEILTSPNGVNWTSQPAPTNATLNAIVSGNGQYVAVGKNGMILTATQIPNNQTIQLSPPMITITSPSSGLQVSNEVIEVSGTTAGNVSVTNVYCSLNNGIWNHAMTENNWTNWTSNLAIVTAGSNSVKAYAADSLGSVSATNTVVFIYVGGSPFLTVSYFGNEFIVSWPPSLIGWILQTNANLSTGTWGNYSGTINNNRITNSLPKGNLFFRLAEP